MATTFRTPHRVALAAFAAAALVQAAEGNHYILPCADACTQANPIAIGPGMTGTWFAPEQSGHGFVLEVLPGAPRQLLAAWFVFAPQGGQDWIVARGPIIGSRAVLEGYKVTGNGGRFPPNFDAANVGAESWGTLTFSFSDCTHGRVEWESTRTDYASGSIDVVRLSMPAGLTCAAGSTAAGSNPLP